MLNTKRLTIFLLSAALLCGASFFASAHAKIRVVATTPDLAALAKEVGGSDVDVQSMALPTQDPHFVDARPSLALALNRADLLLLVGLDLEVGWLPALLTGARNGKIQPGSPGYLDVSTVVPIKGALTGNIDRSMGDIHPAGNPHYMYDPRSALAAAGAIEARMAQLDPDHAQLFAKNRAAFESKLKKAIKNWEDRMAPYRGTPTITYHMSMIYLSDWLGFKEVTQLEPKPGIPPTPSHVARVLLLGRKRNVRLVMQETFYPEKTAKLVAGKIPAAYVPIPGGTNFQGGQDYISFIESIVKSLDVSLKGRRQ